MSQGDQEANTNVNENADTPAPISGEDGHDPAIRRIPGLSALRAQGRALKRGDRTAYDLHFRFFRMKLSIVARLKPRAEFLYPVMRSVAFSDLNSELDAALEKETDMTER